MWHFQSLVSGHTQCPPDWRWGRTRCHHLPSFLDSTRASGLVTQRSNCMYCLTRQSVHDFSQPSTASFGDLYMASASRVLPHPAICTRFLAAKYCLIRRSVLRHNLLSLGRQQCSQHSFPTQTRTQVRDNQCRHLSFCLVLFISHNYKIQSHRLISIQNQRNSQHPSIHIVYRCTDLLPDLLHGSYR